MRFRELTNEQANNISGDAGALKVLLNTVEDLAETVDSKAMRYHHETDIYKNLERDYQALDAVTYVIRNNLKALTNTELGHNSIFLYDIDGDVDNIEAIGAIHVKVLGDIAEVAWLGSYGSSGRKLMHDALAQAKQRGAKKVKVTAKWNSAGFYSKMGLQAGATINNPLAGSKFTDFSGELNEAPLTDYQPLGNFDKTGGFRHEIDRKLVTSPVAIGKAYQFFSRTPFKIRIFPTQFKGGSRYLETGQVDTARLEEIVGTANAQRILAGHDEDTITVVYTSNRGIDRVPFTAWMMAHRLGHTLARFWNPMRDSWQEMEKHFDQQLAEIMQGVYATPKKYAYGTQEDNATRNQAQLSLYNAIGTMRSARHGQINRPGEFLMEMLAQYINSGTVTFNDLPKYLYRRQQAWGRKNILRIARNDAYEEYNELTHILARDMEYYFHNMLNHAEGGIFVM